ncbi:type VII secretion integral membrane protein EccD, partial [Streptomyces yangpuensis]
MSTAGTTGFCRVTVVAPDSRIDVALPEDIAVADVYPELLRLTGQTQPVGAPTGFHLVRRSGTVLDGARTLAAQQVLDGEVLSLRPFAESLPPAVFDDVSDAVASAVVRDRHRWSDDMLRGAGLAGSAVLLVMLGFVLWYADPVRHDMHGLPGIIAGAVGVLLTAVAGVRARVYRDRLSAVALGLGALPHLLIAGSGIVGPAAGQGPGRLQFLLGCVCVLVASVALVALTPSGDAPFVAATFVAATGTLATFAAIATEASATYTAAVCAPVAIGLVAFLPGLSARFARLPIGYAAPQSATEDYETPDRYETAPYGDQDADQHEQGIPLDAEAIAAQARRGHEM